MGTRTRVNEPFAFWRARQATTKGLVSSSQDDTATTMTGMRRARGPLELSSKTICVGHFEFRALVGGALQMSCGGQAIRRRLVEIQRLAR